MSHKRSRNGDHDNFIPKKRIKQDNSHAALHSLDCRNHNDFDKKFPYFRQPSEIGSFSLDIERVFDNSDKQLKAFVKPPDYDNVHFDLRKGYATMIRKDENEKEYINDILRWILQNMDKFTIKGREPDSTEGSKRELNTDFVCWRGLLTKFLCTPYENREGWRVAVTFYKGTYYLCDFETVEKKQQNANRTARDDEMCCWGWKFEQFLTGATPECTPDTDLPYNNCEAFCTVVRSRLDTHSLVFSGEVDAVHTDKLQGRHYIELKTTRDCTHPRQYTSFKRPSPPERLCRFQPNLAGSIRWWYKLIKWWAQSFLVGIPEIVCGYRDDDGVIHRLESFQTRKLPDIAKDIPNTWKPNVCFNFLDQLLSFIKSSIKLDDVRVVHMLEWSPGKPVLCSKALRDSEYNFLPQWYTDV